MSGLMGRSGSEKRSVRHLHLGLRCMHAVMIDDR